MKNLLPRLKTSSIVAFFCLCIMGVVGQPVIGFQSVTSGLNNPVDVVTAPGDNRFFIAQQNGVVRIWDGNSLTDFLNVASILTSPAGGEQGLLSIAFHPGYNANRYFFIWYTSSTGAVTLARYQRNISNTDIADFSSGQVLLSIPKPGSPYFKNHNGGKLNFGPDGMLYVGTGDGGSGGDPFNNAQDGNSLRGKMLRLNVNSFATSEPFYDIPADNPFVGTGDGILDEIYATGLRNPWRWSFDRSNGDMWIGDVGQGAWEEVNWLPAGSTSGVNYGWKCYEGAHVYSTPCSATDTVSPVFEYGHNSSTGGFSITGGYVYRGSEYPALQGYYITVDYVSRNLWLVAPNGSGGFNSYLQSGLPGNIASFGEAADGTLYALSRSAGILYKVIVTSVVPVTISRFTVKQLSGYNLVEWASSSEISALAYDIDYSTNGQTFTTVGQVSARGIASGSDYSFQHSIQTSGAGYYRLASRDINGAINYSNIVRVTGKSNNDIKIYPTFISNNNFTVELQKPARLLQVMNSNGSIVFTKKLQGFSGTNNIVLRGLPKGVYIVSIIGEDVNFKQKIVLQ